MMKGRLQNCLKQGLVLFVVMLLHVQSVVAQNAVYSPVVKDELLLKNLLAKYESLHKASIATFPVKYQKDFEEIAQLRWNGIKALFGNGDIYTSAPAQGYLDALVKEIVSANPELKNKSFDSYFSLSGVPNAAYMGHGIIVFNMGLFRQLENESQAAFILCHEIAHFSLQHSESSIQEYIATLNSEEVQKQLQHIKGLEFRKGEKLEQLLKELTFDSRRHSREHEQEADSLAVELMKRTRFDVKEALSVLSLLDTVDVDTLDMKNALQALFSSKSYPFKKRWLAKEEGLLGGHATIKNDLALADSLKTHPDCSKRMALLTPKINPYAAKIFSKNVVDETTFQMLRRQFEYEIIAHAFDTKNYTKSLYYTIGLIQKNNTDPYLVTQIGKILNGFYKAQKDHQLSKLIDLPSPHFAPSYNQLLQFVQNLYIEDFGALSFYYLQQFQSQYNSYTPFNETYRNSQQNSQQ